MTFGTYLRSFRCKLWTLKYPQLPHQENGQRLFLTFLLIPALCALLGIQSAFTFFTRQCDLEECRWTGTEDIG